MTTPSRRRYVHVMVHHDGAPGSRSWRLPLVGYRLLVGLGVLSVLAIIGALLMISPLVGAAGRVPGLERQVRNLEADNARIRTLAAAIDSLQLGYERVRGMVGVDVVPDLAAAANTSLPVASALDARSGPPMYASGPSAPRYWPTADAGFITRGVVDDGGSDEPHPGVDIAVAIGTPVRASGGGTVVQAGEDAEYGRFVLIDHPSGHQTMYSHLSRGLAARGVRVDPGAVIGLSGNSGRSTAPHLHFEIRRAGRSIDPLTLVQEGR
jgi:murein DD-endopeptidase MepM/ murein hydrolase activator NlpD